MATKILQIIPATDDWRADGQPILAWALVEEGVGERAVVPLVCKDGKTCIGENARYWSSVDKISVAGQAHPKAKPQPKEH